MSDMNSANHTIKKKGKKRSSYLKIYIKTDDFKLNLIPIPFFLVKFVISIGYRIFKMSNKDKDYSQSQLSSEDFEEIFRELKKIVKELKSYPPFEIVSVESGNTRVIIKTK